MVMVNGSRRGLRESTPLGGEEDQFASPLGAVRHSLDRLRYGKCLDLGDHLTIGRVHRRTDDFSVSPAP